MRTINTEFHNILDRILREKLEPFKVPSEIRQALKEEMLAFINKPEKKPFGACVLTPEASMAADEEKRNKKPNPNAAKPKII